MCDYRTLLILLLLIALIYLIKTNRNCAVTLGVAILLVVVLSDYIKREKFQVADEKLFPVADEQLFLSGKKDPIEMTQMQQEFKLDNLEQNISLVKSMLQESLGDVAEKTIPKILIENSCVLPTDNNIPENLASGSGNISANVPVKQEQADEL